MTTLRHNKVVCLKKEIIDVFEPGVPFYPYGRVWKIIDNDVIWIDSMDFEVHKTPKDWLEVIDYTGKYEWCYDGIKKFYHLDKTGYPIFNKIKFQRYPIFIPMITLKKLKAKAKKLYNFQISDRYSIDNFLK